MLKFVNNSSNLIISHIADIDGLGSVILSKLVFNNIDIILCETHELNEVIHSLFGSKYKKIFITDLSVRDELLDIINDNFSNVIHFDHHINNYDKDKYSWSTTIVDVDGFKVCGTSLFYNYLLNNYDDNSYLCTNYVKEFVENVRSYDTWDFQNTNNLDGKRLTEIFSIIGVEDFINKYYKKIMDNYKCEHFSFDSDEINMYKKLEDDISDYINDCESNLIITDFLDYNVGVSISEKYRSEVGHVLSSRHPELDFILIANFVRGTFSFRTNNEIDLNEIAGKIAGGGHKKASGAKMNSDNLKIFFDSIKKGISKVNH